ncbi:Ferm domain containing 6 [Plakobranchus ocellatus]|uniref:Ferm domain containing 6 n=1 Tax=Plakobranchus ocellatus TaxID=259542 RepID=A0AAV3ZGK4_9GAST|nr:Ferm domain containing 6 [Plakobranchus ocellatus]
MTAKSPAAAAALSSKKRKLVNVHLLNGDEHLVNVDVKSKFQEVFNQVVGHLSIRETEYFGLAFKKDDEYHFILLDEKIHKLAPKQWKSGPGEGLDSQGKALINVWFRIQYYVDQVILLRERVTRHQYYLQLKENVVLYNHLYNEEKCLQLAAYALQADHGNFIEEKHGCGYFNPTLYFPYWVVERHGLEYLEKNVPTLHKDLHNMSRNDAELRYIKVASSPPGAHNLHLYTVRKRKSDKACNTWLAVCAKGVEIYEDDAGYKNHISTFLWKDIGKLYFDKKKFEIRSVQSAGGRRFMYYTDCDIKSKYLLNIARGTHMFQMAIQPKLMEIQHLDNEDQKRYRASYTYSDSRDRGLLQHSPSKSVSAAGSSCNQRYSLISDASSNTTSGIVSDRMAVSFDDGDDHSREIMIDCPPGSVSSGTPNQSRSKFQLLSSFKQSPQSSKTSPIQVPRSLELFKAADGKNISPQELSPTSSNGSWRARHVSNPACLKGSSSVPLPSPNTPSQDTGPYSGLRRSGGRKGSFSKQYIHGSLLMSGDRNTSGDSAVSLSGIFSGSDKLAPLSLPPADQQTAPAVAAGKTSGGAASFSLTPPLSLGHFKRKTGPSPPSSLNFSSSLGIKDFPAEQYKSRTSPREVSPYCKPASSPRELSEKLSTLTSPRANIPEHYGSPRSKTLPHTQERSETSLKSQGSPRDVNSDLLKFQFTPRRYAGTGSPRTDSLYPAQANTLQTHVTAWVESDAAQKEENTSSANTNTGTLLPASDQAQLAHTIPVQQQQQQQQQHFFSQQHPLQHYNTQPVYQPQHPLPLSIQQYHVQHLHALHSRQQEHAQLQQTYSHLQQQQQQLQSFPLQAEQASRTATEQYLAAVQQRTSKPHLLQHQQSTPIQPSYLHSEEPSSSSALTTKTDPEELYPNSTNNDTDLAHLQNRYGVLLQYQQSQLSSQPQQPQQQYQQQHSFQQLLQQMNQQAHVSPSVAAQQESRTFAISKEIQRIQSEQPMVLNYKAAQEIEENKENLFFRTDNKEDVAQESVAVVTHEVEQTVSARPSQERQEPVKGNLHPELKHILGQSHAISLPLITALCNDSTLMQDSRSQSGSRSSYDTSTVRSTDSRLTRLSHDTDSRRWSSCCQAGAGSATPEMMLSTLSGRPYSWHSEHFELDSQLSEAVDNSLPHQHLPASTPPNPRAAVTNKHLNMLDMKGKKNHSGAGNSSRAGVLVSSYLLPPQKMIESDPGPSSPRRLTHNGDGTSWWDSPVAIDTQAASWTDVIPYRLPIHQHMLAQSKQMQRTSRGHESQHRQQMVPHRLSSGGHRDSDSSLAHKQMMKENVGIA